MFNKKLALSFLAVILTVFIAAGCGKTDDKNTTDKNTDNKQETKTETKGNVYKVNTKESSINWLGKKVTGQHNGTVDISGGELVIDNGKLTGGKFDIDFRTITVLDLKDEEMNKKLTGHLKSDDFFSAEKFPTGKFEITGVSPAANTQDGSNYEIKGNLTIKGITKPVSFPAKLTVDNNKANAEAKIELDRTEWDIKFRSGKFFENLGDNLIYDKFNLDVKLNAGS